MITIVISTKDRFCLTQNLWNPDHNGVDYIVYGDLTQNRSEVQEVHIHEDLNSRIWKNSKRNEMLEELNLQVAELIQKGAITYSENGFIIISITETNSNFFTQQ